MLHDIAIFLYFSLDILIWIMVLQAVISWLLAFDVLNHNNLLVKKLWLILEKITYPISRPFKRYLGNVNNIDMSFIATTFVLFFFQRILYHYFIN